MSHKAPSEGTKVVPGQNAPTYTEAVGNVPSESLAAESAREGGAFASNTSGSGSGQQYSENQPAHGTGYGGATSGNNPPKAYGGAAPTYVSSQYMKDTKGPHGKNITEGFDDSGTQDGIQKALNTELGSKDDPSRRAEVQMELNNESKSRAAGPKEGGLSGETKYDTLDSNTSA